MAYIWINPVIENMYEPKVLTEFLNKHDYNQIKVTSDWLGIVRKKYSVAVHQTNEPVMDMRCPKTKEILDEMGITSNVTIPTIEPILIHCAREISEREDLQGEEKVITTPCQALADMGNALNLLNTWFVPWNQFLKTLGGKPTGDEPKASPIPPGFFGGLEFTTASVTGEDEILEYLQNHLQKDRLEGIQLVEMLFCKGGCHNGDGIIAKDIITAHTIRMCEP